jgi:hypothetical protein
MHKKKRTVLKFDSLILIYYCFPLSNAKKVHFIVKRVFIQGFICWNLQIVPRLLLDISLSSWNGVNLLQILSLISINFWRYDYWYLRGKSTSPGPHLVYTITTKTFRMNIAMSEVIRSCGHSCHTRNVWC